jgi:hypothetical protein
MKEYTFLQALRNGIRPSHKRNKILREVTQQIIAGRPSNHSSMGATLPFILSELERLKQPYVLLAMPGEGYVVKAAAKIGAANEEADVEGPDQAVVGS